MDIKSNVFIGLTIMFIFIGLFPGIIIEKCSAEEQQADVSFLGEPTYTLKNKIIKNNQVIGRAYSIDVTLYNTGNKRSEELTVNITDEEGFSLRKNHIYLNPDESKIISFNWTTMINRDQKIIVNYFPTDLDAIWNQYNSGSKTLTIKIEDKDGLPATNTPGFELLLIITTVMMYAFLRKKKG